MRFFQYTKTFFKSLHCRFERSSRRRLASDYNNFDYLDFFMCRRNSQNDSSLHGLKLLCPTDLTPLSFFV